MKGHKDDVSTAGSAIHKETGKAGSAQPREGEVQ